MGCAEVDGLTLEACVLRTYAYSEVVVETEAYLKDLRAAERSNGTATVETATGYVRVTRSPSQAADRARADAALAEITFQSAV